MVSTAVPDRWIPTDLMGATVMNRRSPFKVHQALWNPVIDLLALASQKGEVCVRRSCWRRGWKRDIYDVKPLLLERVKTEREIRLETMCWSPDGKILATAFNDGCIHLLDAEKGIVRFTARMKSRVTRMRWQTYDKELAINLINDAASEVIGDLSDCESLTDKSGELNQLKAMKTFCDTIVLGLLGTLLFTVDQDNVVHILAAGVLPVATVEPPLQFLGNCDPYSITVGDLLYCSKQDQLIVVYSSMGQHDAAARPGMNTQLVGFDIDNLKCLKNGLIWTIAYRWLHLVFYVSFVSEAFARAFIDWEDESKEFTEKFNLFGRENDPECPLSDCLINMILTGQASPELVSFYRNVLKPTEWKKMTDWVNKGFSEMIGSIGNELLPGAEALQYNMKQLYSEARCALRSCEAEKLLPKRLFDVDIYPYGKYMDEGDEDVPLKELKEFQNLADDIVNKINEMHLIAVRNRKDLVNFTNWLSQTAPFTAKSKRSAAEMKFDLQLIIEYIMQTAKAKNETGTEGDGTSAFPDNNYSFDKVLQYFEHHQPLKYRLDVSSNSWDLLSEKHSTKTLADCITDCLDALQTIQDIILKNFTTTVIARTNTVLEQGHAEGFEKFSVFLVHDVAPGARRYDEIKWLHTVAKESFAVSCIGIGGSRHFIYGASGKVLYEMQYKVESTENVASCSGGGDMELVSAENSEKAQKTGESVKGVDNVVPKSPTSAKLLRIERQSSSPVSRRLMHFEWYGGGTFYGLWKICKVDQEETVLFRCRLLDGKSYVHQDASGCTESYCSFTVSCHRKLGVAFAENGFRAKWFEIQVPVRSAVSQKQSIDEASGDENVKKPTNEVGVTAGENMEVAGPEPLQGEERMGVGNREAERPQEGMQLRRSVRKRKPLKK